MRSLFARGRSFPALAPRAFVSARPALRYPPVSFGVCPGVILRAGLMPDCRDAQGQDGAERLLDAHLALAHVGLGDDEVEAGGRVGRRGNVDVQVAVGDGWLARRPGDESQRPDPSPRVLDVDDAVELVPAALRQRAQELLERVVDAAQDGDALDDVRGEVVDELLPEQLLGDQPPTSEMPRASTTMQRR